jgi:hypothetical protein
MVARTIPLVLALLAGDHGTAGENAPAGRQDRETGRIEGRVYELPHDEKPPRVKVRSIELFVSDSPHRLAVAEPDDMGRFVFDSVPAGRVRINPIFQLGTDPAPVSESQALLLPMIVRPVATTEIGLFGKGRPLVGTIVLPPPLKPDDFRVKLLLLDPPFRGIPDKDGTFRRDPARELHAVLTSRPLEANLDADGKFRIEGVREGKYRLVVDSIVEGKHPALAFKTALKPGYPEVEHGKITIPFMAEGESSRPHDLGTLEFRVPR